VAVVVFVLLGGFGRGDPFGITLVVRAVGCLPGGALVGLSGGAPAARGGRVTGHTTARPWKPSQRQDAGLHVTNRRDVQADPYGTSWWQGQAGPPGVFRRPLRANRS